MTHRDGSTSISTGGASMTKMSPRVRLFPLAILLAAAMAPAVAEAQAPHGSYECLFFSSARSGLNFTLAGSGRYIDVEGKSGRISTSGAQMTFTGGSLDGQRAQYRGGNPPAVSILGPR